MNPSEESSSFYYQIGLALTQWANVEFELSWLVGSRFPKREFKTATAGFWAIENFRSKIAFVDALLTESGIDDVPEWTTLAAKAETLSKLRNQLAHRHVHIAFDGPMGRRYMLIERKKPGPTTGAQRYAGAVFLRDIVGYRLEFFAFGIQLANYRSRLDGKPEPFPKSLEQPMPTPTLAVLRGNIYEIASTPPRPFLERYWGKCPRCSSAP